MESQYRSHFREGGESFLLSGHAGDDGADSNNAREEKNTAQDVKYYFHFISILVKDLRDSVHEHPEGQQRRASVEHVTDDRILGPGFFFPAEHARHYHDNSNQLQDSEEDRADPPPHRPRTSLN